MSGNSFWHELKRRHVYRVAVAYAVVGWLLIEIATQVFPVLHMPEWTEQLVVMLVLIGFPVALVLAWAFEMTPEGVRRTEPADSPEARPAEQHRHVGRTLDFVIIGVLLVALGVMAWRPWHARIGTPPPAAGASQPSTATPAPAAAEKPRAAVASAPAASTTIAPKKSVAVLPFENLSEDKSNKYFADGMQDLILTKLADIGDLVVISRTSTRQYGSHPQNLRQIGQELGVATLLEGSVQKAGNEVLVNVQLIDASNDHHIWAQSYQRTLDNVFGVEGEVAEKIATALNAKLSPAETKRLATALSANPAANDLYLRAEYFSSQGWTNTDTAAFRQAIPLFRQAIEKAPEFALARAQLSIANSALAWFGGGGEDVRQLDDDARAQANAALKLAPDLPEAHLALGYCDYYGKSDFAAALKSFAAALRLRPNDAAVLGARGFALRRQGKYDEAIDSMKQGLAHDPRNSNLTEVLAETYMSVGRYLDGERTAQHALALDPRNDLAKYVVAVAIALRSGDIDRALAEAQGDSVTLKQGRVILLTLQRKFGAALDLLEEIPDTPDNFESSSRIFSKEIALADLYRYSGNTDQARAHYAKALPALRAALGEQADHPLTLAYLWNAIAAAELGLGKTDAAMASIKASLSAVERSGDRWEVLSLDGLNAGLYAQAGRADEAVPLVERTLSTPGGAIYYSPAILRIDPVWDPIRKDPGFQALLKKYAADRPANVPDPGAPPAADHAGGS